MQNAPKRILVVDDEQCRSEQLSGHPLEAGEDGTGQAGVQLRFQPMRGTLGI